MREPLTTTYLRCSEADCRSCCRLMLQPRNLACGVIQILPQRAACVATIRERCKDRGAKPLLRLAPAPHRPRLSCHNSPFVVRPAPASVWCTGFCFGPSWMWWNRVDEPAASIGDIANTPIRHGRCWLRRLAMRICVHGASLSAVTPSTHGAASKTRAGP